MNDLSIYSRRFDFDVEPIFRIYGDVVGYWNLPIEEHIIDQYDSLINAKLKDLQFELGDVNEPTWKVETLNKETRDAIERMTGLKVRLETNELIEVFHTFHVMYVDNYGRFHNMPIKDVW